MWIPEGYSQVNVIMGGAGLPTGAQWTFGVRNTLDDDPDVVASEIGTHIVSSTLMGNFCNAVSINTIRVKNGPGDDGPFAEVGVSIPGTIAGSVVPPNTSLLVRKNTAAGGRRGSGRFYLPGLDEGDVDGTGGVTSARRTALQADLTALLIALGVGDLTMVLLHSEPGFAPLDIVSLSPQQKVATQRRRLRR